jgi:hypothetical protein
MEPHDWLSIDRDLRATAQAWRSWRRSVRQGGGIGDDPFALMRRVATLSLFRTASDLPAIHPLREPLRRWIYRLTEQRVNRECWLRGEALLRVATHRLQYPQPAVLSLSEMRRRALSDGSRRGGWLDAYLDHARDLCAVTSRLWERRQEVATRMGLGSPDEIELPHPELAAAAEQWLVASAPLAEGHRRRSLAETVTSALGEDASEGWPGALLPRTVLDLLGGARWFDGVDLDPGPLPKRLGASSFLRALGRVGAAWVDACAPSNQPFVVAHDPYGLGRRTLGALWACLPLQPAFLRRQLRISAPRMADGLRVLRRVVLLESRAAALRVKLRAAALRGRGAFTEAYEIEVDRGFGVALSGSLAGSVWRLHVDDGQRLAGLWLAAGLGDALREEHDEDWFRNPRAAEQLRERVSLPPDPIADREQIASGQRSLARLLTAHA